jgi:DNA repair exonuclease SbcCD ATPase subunit
VVCNALYIGQQEIATVLSGTDKQRKELFSRFLRLDRFLTATEAVRKDLHKVEDKLAQVTQWHSELEEVIAALQESLKHFGRVPDIQEVQQEVLTANTYLAKVQTELALAQQKAQKNGQSTQAARRLEVYWAGKVSIIKERLWAAQQKLQTLPVSASQCPTCLQPVTQAWVTKASEEQHLRVGKLSRILANRQASLSKAERQFASTEKKEVRCYKRAMELSQRIPEVTAKIATLQALVNKAAERQQLQQQIEGKKQVQRRHKDAIAAYEGDQEMLQEALKVVSRNGLPSYLCTTACPMLNKASQEYSQLLTEGKIEVQFLVNEGEVDIQVVNHNGGDTITDQSQGEGRLAGLIAAFSLRRVFANYNLLILDEPGEGLDSHNAEVFARSLNQIAKQFGSLYITTHNPFILGNLKPSRHLEVVKSKGTSKVEERL